MIKKSILLSLAIIISINANELIIPKKYNIKPNIKLNKVQSEGEIISNDIYEVYYLNNQLWILTGEGAAFSEDWGNSWTYQLKYNDINQYIFSLGYNNNYYYATAGYMRDYASMSQPVPVGTGIYYRHKDSSEWQFEQIKFADEFPQKVGFEIAFKDSSIFIAYLRGNLIRKNIKDSIWTIIIPDEDSTNDTLETTLYPPSFTYVNNFNNIALSLKIDKEGIIWLGTAAGIKKSEDNGKTFTQYGAGYTPNFLGNQIWELYIHYFNDKKYIVASCTSSGNPGESNGAIYSDNNGETWHSIDGLQDIAPLAITGKDSLLWFGTDGALYSFNLNNKNLEKFTTQNGLPDDYIASLCAIDFYLWIGTYNGLTYTVNNGKSFDYFKKSYPVTYSDLVKTYSFPNPISTRDNQQAQIVFALKNSNYVTLKIYDMSMNLIRTLFENKFFDSSDKIIVKWDGRDDNGDYVPNGTYLYIIDVKNKEKISNKITILN